MKKIVFDKMLEKIKFAGVDVTDQNKALVVYFDADNTSQQEYDFFMTMFKDLKKKGYIANKKPVVMVPNKLELSEQQLTVLLAMIDNKINEKTKKNSSEKPAKA